MWLLSEEEARGAGLKCSLFPAHSSAVPVLTALLTQELRSCSWLGSEGASSCKVPMSRP